MVGKFRFIRYLNPEREKASRLVKDVLIISVGLLINSLGWVLFILPAEITGGGISGVSAVVFYATKIPMGVTFLAINLVLVIIAIRFLGASFGLKTLFSIGILTLFFTLFQELFHQPIIKDDFLSAVLGGMLGGIGVGIVFSRGGSTGGTDIIALIINKYRNVSPGRIILYCDVIIIASSYLVFFSPEKLVYGYVTMWVVSFTLDSFLSGANRSAQLFIFSPKYADIADFITEESNRGVTVLDGTGWYSKDNVKIVITVVKKRETSSIFRKIKEIDPEAFISMGSVMGVYGKGFDQIKL